MLCRALTRQTGKEELRGSAAAEPALRSTSGDLYASKKKSPDIRRKTTAATPAYLHHSAERPGFLLNNALCVGYTYTYIHQMTRRQTRNRPAASATHGHNGACKKTKLSKQINNILLSAQLSFLGEKNFVSVT